MPLKKPDMTLTATITPSCTLYLCLAPLPSQLSARACQSEPRPDLPLLPSHLDALAYQSEPRPDLPLTETGGGSNAHLKWLGFSVILSRDMMRCLPRLFEAFRREVSFSLSFRLCSPDFTS